MSDQSQEPVQTSLPEGEAIRGAEKQETPKTIADIDGGRWLRETLKILNERFDDELRELAQ